MHSVLSLPLLTPDGVLGAMNVYAHGKAIFDDHAVNIGELFSVPAAIAVQNALVLAQAKRLATNLQAALVSRAVIDQAMGIVMSRTGCTAAEAFDRLRARSQTEHIKVSAVAQSVVDAAVRRARARRAIEDPALRINTVVLDRTDAGRPGRREPGLRRRPGSGSARPGVRGVHPRWLERWVQRNDDPGQRLSRRDLCLQLHRARGGPVRSHRLSSGRHPVCSAVRREPGSRLPESAAGGQQRRRTVDHHVRLQFADPRVGVGIRPRRHRRRLGRRQRDRTGFRARRGGRSRLCRHLQLLQRLTGRVPTITLLPPPPLTTTPTPSTVTATPATITSTVAAVTSTVSSTSVVVAVKYLSDTGSHASELLPVGAGLVAAGAVLLLFGRRRRGTHLG